MKRIYSLTLSLFLQFHLLFALSENHYGDCEPRKCGNQIIKYPFHIQNDQKPYCGHPGFGVSCNSDSFPVFNISGDAYIIKNISYESQKFQVINSALVKEVPSSQGCFHSLHNLSIQNDLMKFSTYHDYVYVFPDCPEKVLKEYRDKRVNCGSLAMYKNDSKLQDLEKKCKGVVIKVPYNNEGQTKGKVMDMLERGVLLNWKAYNCTACLETGGQCGFDEPNNQFNCFCLDRTHALHCPPIQQVHRDAYIIKNISYESQKFQVINSALVKEVPSSQGCFHPLHNLSIQNDLMKFSTNHDYVYVFPDCPEKVLKEYREKIVECGKLAVYKNDSKLQDLKKKCNGVVIEVPYYDEGQTKGKVMDMLERGVLLNWKAYNCTACLETGGHCGFDEPNNQFNCFCPDRTHSLFCTSSQPPIQEPWIARVSSLSVVLGSSLGAVVLVTLIVIIICGKRRQRTKRFTALWNKGTAMNQNVEAFLKSYGSLAPKRYTYREIRKMTSNFKHKLGEGGYGAVYKGNQHDSRLVAVKKLKKLEGDGDDFINEVVSMGRTNHVNIVTLLGFCFEGNKRALVFEFLPNGSLEKFIYSSASGQSLPSNTLYSIAVGIAKGLDYLHRGCNTRILHFDIKPHNILLDEELRPKISDFGLARLCCPKESLISMSEARGTIGYIAPEVFCRNFGGVSHKSDVYSYGMMLLDMVCGRNNVVAEAQRTSDMYFPDWIYRRLELRDEIENDGIIEDDEAKQLQRKMILVGLWCIQSYPSNRPPMNRVLEMLEGQLESLKVPPKPHISCPPNPVFDPSENSMLSMGN
ncbi:LEAF RUST 10 DISEASE-RESISTANCE LOCUS RECEPTOR-LIKE PROTEIN KINASE-like 2.1 isoform X1 [Chenopodium quinoa]|uniref:LEAF RUST 10 DISEASE-RESISTANCE LOCUS RECEPTOR-LIKE PROTEIN KINASE-like 2.1 isoform X1 n=1 Tax=Chenopodium quinoa TaxID=63459 RepID=UPI000B78FB3C|nr:LEAF RUST 10 DISEASE-RESISTANCE LOCUS RECEPTOR-LIKE PROTEIN KINASE-like 2.1 isoform X1 [Chenopodium quinoa]